MPVWVSRWWQELTHPCKYLKNNDWRTSRPSPTYLINNSNNCQGLATQQQRQSHLWSTIDTSSRSVIHMSQLGQPGDYLKNNRTVPPRIHTSTAEKTRTENKLLHTVFPQAARRRQFSPSYQRRQLSSSHRSGQLSSSYKREQLETATKRIETKNTKKTTHIPKRQQRTV